MPSTNYTIRITTPVEFKDVNNVTRTLEIGDTTLDQTCYLQHVVSLAKIYGGHIADGWYSFLDVLDGPYKLYKDVNTPLAKWHGTGNNGRWLGDGDGTYVDKSSNETVGGIKNFSSSPLVPAATTTGQAVAYQQLADYVKRTVGYTWTQAQIFQALVTVPDAQDPGHAVNLKILTEAINGIGTAIFPYGTNVRKVLPDADVVVGQNYKTFQAAKQSCGSPSASNRYLIIMGADMISVNHTDLETGIDIIGESPDYGIILGGGAIPADKDCVFRNITIYLGAYGFTGDRIYPGSIKFRECRFYAYKDTTFSCDELKRCEVYHANTFKATLTDGINANYTEFSQFISRVTEPNFRGEITEGVQPGTEFTMPADPTDMT